MNAKSDECVNGEMHLQKQTHRDTHTVLCEESDKGLKPSLRVREPPMSTQTGVKTRGVKKTKQVMHKGDMKYLWGRTDLPYSFFLFLLLKGVNGEITHIERGKGHRHGPTLREKKKMPQIFCMKVKSTLLELQV